MDLSTRIAGGFRGRISASALQPFELAGATRVGPRTPTGEGSFLLHTGHALEMHVYLIAILHRDYGVAPVLRLHAGQINGLGDGERCRFQPGHLEWHTPGTGVLLDDQHVASRVADLNGLRGVWLAAFDRQSDFGPTQIR